MPEPSASDHLGDPVLRHADLRHVVEIPLLGVPVRFETNAPSVLAIVERAFGAWHGLSHQPDLLSAIRVSVRIVLQPGEDSPEGSTSVASRLPDRERLLLSAPGIVGVADVARRQAIAYVTSGVVSRQDYFRRGVLEALTLFLVTHCDRVPFHAAAIAGDGPAILLAGSSGTGKSCLAYAAFRAGLKVLSDDAVYVQLDPELRVWGLSSEIRLPEDAHNHFPELADLVPRVQPNGKRKIVVDLVELHRRSWSPIAERSAICILSRHAGSTLALEPISASEVVARLEGRVEPGFDLFNEELRSCVARLGERGGWHLTLGNSPVDAAPLLARMLVKLEAQG